MNFDMTLDKLQRASAAAFYHRTTRLFGWRTLAMGLVFGVIGATSLEYFFAAVPFLVVAIWLTLYAMLMLTVKPRTAILIGDISGFVCLLINGSLLLYEAAFYSRPVGHLPRALPGIALIIIAFGFVHFTYKRFAQSAPPHVDIAEKELFEKVLQAVLKANPRTDETIITVSVNNTTIKGKIDRDLVIFTTHNGREVSPLTKAQFEMVADQKLSKRNEYAVKIRMGQQWAAGRTDVQSYLRYQQWKSSLI